MLLIPKQYECHRPCLPVIEVLLKRRSEYLFYVQDCIDVLTFIFTACR